MKINRITTGFLICISFINSIIAQNINSIKTEKECLVFINKKIKNFKFETFFTKTELSKLQLPYKKWGIVDFNNDGRLDLYFTSYSSANRNYQAYLYLSKNDNYKLLSLTRFAYQYYRPFLFSKRVRNSNLLFLYSINNEIANNSNRTNFISNDTIIYTNENVINFTMAPTKLEFDSIFFTCTSQDFIKDSVILYSNKNIIYYNLGLERKKEFCRSSFNEDRQFYEKNKFVKEVIQFRILI
jgi:hypothetical protein